jgi:hypothetical protein
MFVARACACAGFLAALWRHVPQELVHARARTCGNLGYARQFRHGQRRARRRLLQLALHISVGVEAGQHVGRVCGVACKGEVAFGDVDNSDGNGCVELD